MGDLDSYTTNERLLRIIEDHWDWAQGKQVPFEIGMAQLFQVLIDEGILMPGPKWNTT